MGMCRRGNGAAVSGPCVMPPPLPREGAPRRRAGFEKQDSRALTTRQRGWGAADRRLPEGEGCDAQLPRTETALGPGVLGSKTRGKPLLPLKTILESWVPGPQTGNSTVWCLRHVRGAVSTASSCRKGPEPHSSPRKHKRPADAQMPETSELRLSCGPHAARQLPA